MAQSYRVSNGNKILMVIFLGSFFFLGGIYVMVYPYLESPPKPPGTLLFLTLLGLGMTLGSLYAILWSFRFQVEVESGFMRVRGVFGEREIPFGDIQGYGIIPGRSVTFYGAGSRKILSFFLVLENQDKFLQWARHQFKDAVTEAADKEWNGAMADERLGADEAERKDTLNRARQLVNGLGIVTFGVGIWSLLNPHPYSLVMGVLMFLPVVTLLAVLFSRGAIRFNTRKNGTYASADFSLIAVWFLALRALIDWDVLDWAHFWLPFAAITLALFTPLMVFSESARSKGLTLFTALFYFAIYGAGATLELNGILDPSLPATYESHVVGKRISHGKSTSYYLTLAPWGPVPETKDYRVSRSSYQQHETGDRVSVDLREGALHIPYCSID